MHAPEQVGAGVGVAASGAGEAEAVQRPEPRDVAVVPFVELSLDAQVLAVVEAACLRVEERRGGVAQVAQRGELGAVLPRSRLERLGLTAHDADELVADPVDRSLLGVRREVVRRRRGLANPWGHLAWHEGQASTSCLGCELPERAIERADDVTVELDAEVVASVHAVPGDEAAEHQLRAGRVPLVDVAAAAVDVGAFAAQPVAGMERRVTVSPPAEHDEVGDDVSAGGGTVGRRGQPDRADEVGQARKVSSGAERSAVECEPRREQRDDAAGTGERHRLHEEVVVDRVAGAVVHRVVEGDLGEGHVPDDEVDRIGEPCGLEALVPDVGVRVEKPRDASGDGLELDADGGGVEAVRAGRQEDTGAAARFEDPAAVEPQRRDEPPDGRSDRGVGVVRVQGRASSRRQLRGGEQRRELVAQPPPRGIAPVERVRKRTPPCPSRQDATVVASRDPCVGVELSEQPERGEVRLGFCRSTRRRERRLVSSAKAAG